MQGDGYGVSVLYNSVGELRALFTHKRLQEKIHTGGISTLRISTRNELLEEYAITIMDKLHWNGVAMVEFKYDKVRKKGWFIEINPRFWGSLALPYIAGIDFSYLLYLMMKEGDINPVLDYKTGIKVKWILGSFIAFITDIINLKKLKFNHIFSKANGYDDLWYDDPKSFMGENIYYLSKLFQTRSLNPTKNSLFDIDQL